MLLCKLQFSAFDREDAWRPGTALRCAAPDNDAWLERKAAVVTHFERSSMGVGEQFRALGPNFEEDSRLPSHRYAANGGVFPIRLRGPGTVIGTVGVSGLPQREDHAFLVQQLRAFLSAQ